MAEFPWSDSNWFNLVQTIGIVAGLGFTAVSIAQEAKALHISNLLAFSEKHRSLWLEATNRPELSRIFLPETSLLEQPATIVEEEFLNLVFVHFELGWQMAKTVDRGELESLAADVGHFFLLPLPHTVWAKTKGLRNRRFVRFVERALSAASKTLLSNKRSDPA